MTDSSNRDPRHVPLQCDRGGGDRKGSSSSTLQVRLLIDLGGGFDNSRVELVWGGIRDINKPSVGGVQFCGRETSSGISGPTAGHIDEGTRFQDNGISCGERDRPTGLGKFPDGALDKVRITGCFAQGRAHPVRAVKRTSLADINDDVLTSDRAIALKGAIRQFRASQLEGHEIFPRVHLDATRT